MKGLLSVVSFTILCLLPRTPATAQNPTRQAIELDALGRTSDNRTTGPYRIVSSIGFLGFVGVNHEQIFGGPLAGYSFALSPHLALETRAGFLFGHQPSVVQSGGQELLVHAGLRGAYPIRHSRFAFIARVEPGISSFSSAYRSGILTATQNPNGTVTLQLLPIYTRLTQFSLEEGVGLSARLTARTALHLDVSHETLLEADRHQGALGFPPNVEDHALVSAGISRAFGHALAPAALESSPSTPAPPNELILSCALQPQVHLNGPTFATDSGLALTGSHFLKPWLALDTSIVFLATGDSPYYQDGGHETEFFMGVKLGFQRPRYGLFLKARPGLASFPKTIRAETAGGPSYDVASDAALDGGAVLEFYPARHLLLRADLGEVLTHYAQVGVTLPTYMAPQPTQTFQQAGFNAAAGQFLLGVGWRF